MQPVIVNLALFKVAWVACIVAAAVQLPLVGTAAVALAAAYHLVRAQKPRSEVVLLAAAAVLGFCWESALVAGGVLAYESGVWYGSLAPYWIVAMWVLFATTLNVGLRWLRKSRTLAVAFGAIGGPLSFAAGAKAGAVTLADPQFSLLVIAVGWAVLLPLMVVLSERFDGHAAVPAKA